MCKVFVLLVQTYCFFASKQCVIKQLLDSVFVISGIIKVSVSVISFGLLARLITLSFTSTLIIPDITKTPSPIFICCQHHYHALDHHYQLLLLLTTLSAS